LEDTDEEIYLEGWVEGALHFWKAVKTRLWLIGHKLIVQAELGGIIHSDQLRKQPR
jgi:hypothetical protein